MNDASSTRVWSDPGGVVIGVDVGGTKVLAGVVDPDGTVHGVVQVSTPGRTAPVPVLEDALDEAVRTAAGSAPLAAVGLSAAGFVDAAGERVAFAPHLPWRDDPVRSRLSQRWGVPVALENDATCALIAERAHGVLRGVDSAVMVTLGTGIGGGLLVGGQVIRGAGGMAGEYGHMRLVPEGRPCECGGAGCWEQYCSGRALLREARSLLGTAPSSLDTATGGDPRQLTGPMVTAAAQAGDGVALQACAAVGRWLGIGLAGVVAAVDPAVVVIGGGAGEAGELLLGPAREHLARHLVGAAHRQIPELVLASAGSRAGLLGAGVTAHALLA